MSLERKYGDYGYSYSSRMDAMPEHMLGGPDHLLQILTLKEASRPKRSCCHPV